MNSSEKRRPGSSGSPLRSNPNPNPNRNSMPAPPPRAAVGTTSSSSNNVAEEALEGGVALADRQAKEKDPLSLSSSRSGSVKDKDRDKDRNKDRKEKDKQHHHQHHQQQQHQQQLRHKEKDRERERELVLREKDDRIAYLEKELDIMEREFQRELDKLSQNESETATFWQGRHSALNQQFLRTDTELRLLRAEVEVREAERGELREGWVVLRRELNERDEEIQDLRRQVRGLKEWVSSSTRTGGQECDETFGDGVAKLGNGLQNWVIMHFRKAKLDLSNVDETTLAEVAELVPMYEELVATAKVHLLGSIVSRILVEHIFNAYFVGLSDEQEEQFRQMEKLIASFRTYRLSHDYSFTANTSSILGRTRQPMALLDPHHPPPRRIPPRRRDREDNIHRHIPHHSPP